MGAGVVSERRGNADLNAEMSSRRSILIAYLYMKADSEDWHGVSDAANDLREIDAAAKERARFNAEAPECRPLEN